MAKKNIALGIFEVRVHLSPSEYIYIHYEEGHAHTYATPRTTHALLTKMDTYKKVKGTFYPSLI